MVKATARGMKTTRADVLQCAMQVMILTTSAILTRPTSTAVLRLATRGITRLRKTREPS